MLGIVVNEMQRSLSGPAEAASRDALFHYQMTHLDPNGPQMRVAVPSSGWWSTRRVVPTVDMDRPIQVLPKRVPQFRQHPAYDARDALFHYQMTNVVPYGPQMRVADPTTGWWSTRRVVPYATHGRRFETLPKIHHGLGDVPNDFEAAIDLQYTPVRQGWFYGEPVQGFPNHRHRLHEGDPQVFVGDEAIAMLGGSVSAAVAANGDVPTLQRLVHTQRMQTVMQFVSTLSIASLASIGIYKFLKESRAKPKMLNGLPRRRRVRAR